ncbi:MAG: SIR2 family protein [Bdellovibrionaceae bacterium]|nr:SIR2 family protein [Pseudobdellovibrionaceae bacterium]
MKKTTKVKRFKVTPEIEDFLDRYVKAIEERTAAIFAGAGLSIPAGFVDWRGLLRKIAKEIRLNVDQENDLIAVAQYHVNEKGGRHRINEALVNEFSRKANLTENHRILARLPIQTYWTTNYDHLIEEVLDEAGKTPDVKKTVPSLAVNVPMRDAIVYKMHGDVSLADEAVVTKDDYEGYSSKRELFSTALRGDLVDKTFLFLGFSFSDPNIEYILSRIRILLGKDQREHFCLMRRVHPTDPAFKNNRDAYIYAKTKQKLQIRDLKRFAIKVILLDDYHDVTTLLRMIETRVKRKRVFISGSAETYEPFGEPEARQFVHELGKSLVKGGYEVVTGFGVGVGDAVINGALDHIFSTKFRRVDPFLILRPFPQFATGGKSLPALWTQYRESILDEAGVAIFLFGNKRDKKTGAIVLANGVKEEFEIALKKGMPVIPVGFTGHMAGALLPKLSKVKGSWKTKQFLAELKRLEKKPRSLTASVPKILKMIRRLQEERY